MCIERKDPGDIIVFTVNGKKYMRRKQDKFKVTNTHLYINAFNKEITKCCDFLIKMALSDYYDTLKRRYKLTEEQLELWLEVQ
jgi:hypothetical protein